MYLDWMNIVHWTCWPWTGWCLDWLVLGPVGARTGWCPDRFDPGPVDPGLVETYPHKSRQKGEFKKKCQHEKSHSKYE